MHTEEWGENLTREIKNRRNLKSTLGIKKNEFKWQPGNLITKEFQKATYQSKNPGI